MIISDLVTELSSDLSRVNVYVGSDGKIHYVNKDGADTALPFSRIDFQYVEIPYAQRSSFSCTAAGTPVCVIATWNNSNNSDFNPSGGHYDIFVSWIKDLLNVGRGTTVAVSGSSITINGFTSTAYSKGRVYIGYI